MYGLGQKCIDFCQKSWVRALSGQRDGVKHWSAGVKQRCGEAFKLGKDCELLQGGAAPLSTEVQPGCVGGQWVSGVVLAVMRSIISVLLRGILPLTSLGWAQGFCHEASIPSALLKMCTKVKYDEEFISRGLIFWMG